MFRNFSIIWICVVSLTTFSNCRPADLENTCDVRSKSYLLATVIRYATGDRSSSCLPAFSFFEPWGVYDSSAVPKIAALTYHQGHIIAGGTFKMTGIPTGNIALVDAMTGKVIPNRFCPHLKVIASYSTTVSDGSGGFYIGGDFQYVQGIKRNQVAHILPGCQLDPNFNPVEDPSRVVTSLSILGNQLYVGGMFTSWGSGSQKNLASINRYTGELNTEFYAGDINNSVFDITTDGTAIYIGGHFSMVGATAKQGIAKLSPITGSLDTSFIGQAPGQVNDIHLGTDSNGTPVLYVVGPFAGGAISFFLNGTQTSWAPNPNSEVAKVTQYENTIYLCGNFTTIGATPANYLVGVDNQLGAIKENSFGINNNVKYGTVIGNKLYVLGEFTEAKGIQRNYAASFDLPSNSLNIWDPNFNSGVYFPSGEIVSSGSSLLIASNFTAANMMKRNNFVVFEEATGNPIEGTPFFDFQITSFHIKDNHLFVGGSFENINGIPRVGFAILDLPTYQLNQTNLNVSGTGSPEIRSITSNENQIFFGGFGISSVSGQTRNALAAIDSNSLTLTNWNPDLGSNSASSLLVLNDLVYVGGIFTSMNGVAGSNNYRAVDTINGFVTSLPASSNYPNSEVAAQSHFAGKILIGGIFTTIGSLGSFSNMATYDTTIQSYITPNPIYANATVSSITVSPEGIAMVGGSFSGLNGDTTSQFLAAFNANTYQVLDWKPNPNNIGHSSFYRNGKWYIGGDFNKVFNKPFGGFYVSDLTEKTN
ncbi:hypothetical protein [Leptospira brenneri]|uniref:hypothetical protein n=1 Tax=Leptospira brenneri TaxID=2023182 RepID=UPI000C2ADADE|nr:hypothetical protein [Leptospira brenneri]PJZ44510.1 hypothetical protein CH361_15530 [Leptospira brenneri]